MIVMVICKVVIISFRLDMGLFTVAFVLWMVTKLSNTLLMVSYSTTKFTVATGL